MDRPVSARPLSTSAISFIKNVKPLLINGIWLSGSDPILVENPSTGQSLLTLGQSSDADVDSAVEAARAAFEGRDWALMRAVDRARLLFRLADLVERDAAIIAELETADNGMPITLSRDIALPLAIELLRYYAGWVTKLRGETLPAAQGAQTLTYTRREPVGVAAQIIPWNVPFVMAVLKIAPALAVGCTVVLKPAELTPLTALYLGKLVLEAGFPPGALAHRMAHIVRAGQVSINCHGAVDVNVPFGGYKQSGWGREYGEAALHLYTETKAITVRL